MGTGAVTAQCAKRVARASLLYTLACALLIAAVAPPVRATEHEDAEEWTTQTSGTTENLNAVSFVDELYGHAVGNKGTILATVDGGRTWSTQFLCGSGCPAPFQVNLVGSWSDVSFADRLRGHTVGSQGRILATTDGGFTWFFQDSDTEQTLRGVSFVDADHGFAVGEGGVIIATVDGGRRWTGQTSGTTQVLRRVSFVDARNGHAVGDGGTILATTDGGASWNPQDSGTTGILMDVSFVDELHGHVVGHNGTILGTSDGGATWVREVSGTGAALFGVSFTDAELGHAVGTFGTVLATADGGVTWTSQTSGTTRHLVDVSFVRRYGHAAGDDGAIVATGAVHGRRATPRR